VFVSLCYVAFRRLSEPLALGIQSNDWKDWTSSCCNTSSPFCVDTLRGRQ